ncbi:thioredoxin fold domain-containing protein [Candidatus Bathyarchaeota archaeon]|nr:thioredoxin fold domain-containing protein [Candidatus Bathyarchaeota archaeon]MBS7631356.1 thioredoxin fold domain-containing protein [Candidatus Bathyarchaeota archaeon]
MIEVNSDNWEKEVLQSDKPVVVDFWHSMCGWCLRFNPVFDKLPERFGEKVKFAKFNVLQNFESQKLALSQGVLGTPTLKFYCNGRGIAELVGYRPLDRLVNEVEEIISKKDECLSQSTPLK